MVVGVGVEVEFEPPSRPDRLLRDAGIPDSRKMLLLLVLLLLLLLRLPGMEVGPALIPVEPPTATMVGGV